MRWTRWASLAALAACASGCHDHRKSDAVAKPSAAPSATAPVTTAAPVATAAPTSHEGQRPPKPTPVASVTPPKLPKLKAQAVHIPPPKSKATKDEAPCGTVWTGEEE